MRDRSQRQGAKRCLVLTGGGTAGHVVPHFAVLERWGARAEELEIHYLGSRAGIERQLCDAQQISYHPVATGKLRRYLAWENVADLGRVAIGVLQSIWLLSRLKPHLIFSKGGFVSVPVCVAGWLLRIPVITHESDRSPGLATRLVSRFARQILCTFPDTPRLLPPSTPSLRCAPLIRGDLQHGDAAEALRICGFSARDLRPIVLVMGGSLGADKINQAVITTHPTASKAFRIIHLTGQGKATLLPGSASYFQCEYADARTLAHFYALCSGVVSRAGAGAVFELLALAKPVVLVPLEAGSRGDQLENAAYAAEIGRAGVVPEAVLATAPETLWHAVQTQLDRPPPPPPREGTTLPQVSDVLAAALGLGAGS